MRSESCLTCILISPGLTPVDGNAPVALAVGLDSVWSAVLWRGGRVVAVGLDSVWSAVLWRGGRVVAVGLDSVQSAVLRRGGRILAVEDCHVEFVQLLG